MYHVYSSIHLNVYIYMYQAYFVYTFKSVFLFVAASFDLGILERGIFICSTLVSSCLFRVWSFHV